MTNEISSPQGEQAKSSQQSHMPDVVIGVLIGIDKTETPLVIYPDSHSEAGVIARSTVSLSPDDIGCEVALLFENGDITRPLIIGRIKRPSMPQSSPDKDQDEIQEGVQEFVPEKVQESTTPIQASLDGERLEFNAKQEIVLKCGKASITLTKSGKILIRGTYLLSRSSGANRIKGGSIQLN